MGKMNGKSRLTYFLRRSTMEDTALQPLRDFILDFLGEGWVFYFFLLLFMHVHITSFNRFTLRPRYDFMRFFVTLTLKVLDEFLSIA